MTDERRQAIEARLEYFNREIEELWRLWHDPHHVAEHLAQLLRDGQEVAAELALAFALVLAPSALDYFF